MSAGPLSSWFTGWVVEPDTEDFIFPCKLVGSAEEVEDDDTSYELPDPDVNWTSKPSPYKNGPPPGMEEEAAWAGLSLTLSSLSQILGGERRAYQLNYWDKDDKGRDHGIIKREYTFQFKPGDTGYQGGDRL